MKRGTNVGQAYVSGTFDGDGMNEEIVDSVEAAGPGVDKAGDRHGKRYGDRFSDSFFNRLRTKFGKRIAQRLRLDVERDGRDAGDAMGNALIQGIRERLEKADDLSAMLLDRIANDNGRSHKRLELLARNARTAELAAARLERELRAVMRAESMIGTGGGGGLIGRRGNLLGDRLGRFLGAGSRNDFLNFFGRSLGNAINLADRGRLVFSSLFSAFRTGFTAAEEGASTLTKTMSGVSEVGVQMGATLSKALAGLASGGPAAAVAIVVLVTAMSALVSVASALLAVVTALIATIASGLVGALAVAGGAVMAVVAAGGLLVAMFMSMTDAQKNFLKTSFQPLRAEMVGIGQLMLDNLRIFDEQTNAVVKGTAVFGVWSRNLQQALLLVAPVAQVMGAAFAQAGAELTRSFSGPGFQAMSNALSVWLPTIITQLSVAFGGFLNGTMGMFAALMPFVNQFAGYLQQIGDRFSRWANSAVGQNAIVDFADRALASLQSLWGFVREFSGWVADVLFSPEAQNFGNNMFDGLARSFAGFRQSIADGALQSWFNDAARFGSQLWDVLVAIGDAFEALYSSGVLNAVGVSLEAIAIIIQGLNTVLGPLVDFLGFALGKSAQATLATLQSLVAGFVTLGESVEWVGGLLNKITSRIGLGSPFGNGAEWSHAADSWTKTAMTVARTIGLAGQAQSIAAGLGGVSDSWNRNRSSLVSRAVPAFSLSNLVSSGNRAISMTTSKNQQKYHNPYAEWAKRLIKDNPSVAAQIKAALGEANKSAAEAINEMVKSSSSDSVQKSLDSLQKSLTDMSKNSVSTAQQALNSAAQTLANATSSKEAKAALKKVKTAQYDLLVAVTNQQRINDFAKTLTTQKIVREQNVAALLNGYQLFNTTLADFAEARERLTKKIEDANDKLQEAIRLRDDYKTQVADSIRSFGSLVTAQAKVIDGVQQALTADDIVGNLEDRLTRIRSFQDNLRVLLAQGLSNEAYKQIVDKGVEDGAAYAEALVQGGQGAVQQTNALVSQIGAFADSLGLETSNRMYQAGVDAAQGLVDGLNSLSAQLEASATRLGNEIAAAVRKALGIHSPSTVMIDSMNEVGDGAVIGLNNQRVKVGRAAASLASEISITPVARGYSTESESSQRGGVSGNDDARFVQFRDFIVQTPTENPKAVAVESINELIGRIS